jgi:aryl-alcohol dehydrogenase-like predicted oxidoreductase
MIDYLDNRAVIAACDDAGIAVTVFEPLGSGVLTGRTLEQVRASWTGPWRDSPFYKRLLGPGNGEQSFALADALRPIAQRLDATVAQVAIAWVLHQPGVTAALAGSRSEVHTRENAGATDLHLSDDLLEELEALIPLGPAFA